MRARGRPRPRHPRRTHTSRYQDAWHTAARDAQGWIARAWVTYFGGSGNGLEHAMMVTNLVRSVHLFSTKPIVVFVVATAGTATSLSPDWDPKVFPRLIVLHAAPLAAMGGAGASFNFNKFRSMLIRVRTGVQVDADMLVAPHCDQLFAATEAQVTAAYPFPILPVHWMSRYAATKPGEAAVDRFARWAVSYVCDGNEEGCTWPPRLRWAHCHPTWTFHALPFVADALLAKLNADAWATLPRVVAGVAGTNASSRGGAGASAVAEPNPPEYLGEDEDLLNILLWRHKGAS